MNIYIHSFKNFKLRAFILSLQRSDLWILLTAVGRRWCGILFFVTAIWLGWRGEKNKNKCICASIQWVPVLFWAGYICSASVWSALFRWWWDVCPLSPGRVYFSNTERPSPLLLGSYIIQLSWELLLRPLSLSAFSRFSLPKLSTLLAFALYSPTSRTLPSLPDASRLEHVLCWFCDS